MKGQKTTDKTPTKSATVPQKTPISKTKAIKASSRPSAVSLEQQEKIFTALNEVLLSGGKRGSQVIAGVNSVLRKLCSGNAAAISLLLLSKDSSPMLHEPVMAAARARNIPAVVLPKSERKFGALLGIRTCSCIAVDCRAPIVFSCPDGVENDGLMAERRRSHLLAKLDNLIEIATNSANSTQ